MLVYRDVYSQFLDRLVERTRGLKMGDTQDKPVAIGPMINRGQVEKVEPHVPFGGVKASGTWRNGGRWSVETFTETRWITLNRGGRPFPPVF